MYGEIKACGTKTPISSTNGIRTSRDGEWVTWAVRDEKHQGDCRFVTSYFVTDSLTLTSFQGTTLYMRQDSGRCMKATCLKVPLESRRQRPENVSCCSNDIPTIFQREAHKIILLMQSPQNRRGTAWQQQTELSTLVSQSGIQTTTAHPVPIATACSSHPYSIRIWWSRIGFLPAWII